MLNYPEFVQHQEKIHQKLWFGYRDAIKEGLVPDPAYQNRASGVGIVLRPQVSIMQEFAQWTLDMKRVLPSVLVYRPTDLHTTVTVTDVPGSDEEKDRLVDIFHDAVEETVQQWASHDKSRLMSKLNRAIFNRTTALVTAYPASELIEMMSFMLERVRVRGVLPVEPWGVHMTLARFTELVSPEILEKSELARIVETCPIVQRDNVFSAVDIVSYELNQKGMNFVVHHRFPL